MVTKLPFKSHMEVVSAHERNSGSESKEKGNFLETNIEVILGEAEANQTWAQELPNGEKKGCVAKDFHFIYLFISNTHTYTQNQDSYITKWLKRSKFTYIYALLQSQIEFIL